MTDYKPTTATIKTIPPHIADVAAGCVRECLRRGEKAAAIAVIEHAFIEAGQSDQFDGQTPVATLELPTSVRYALEDAGVMTVLALECLTCEQLMAIPRIGRYALESIRRALANIGRTLRGEGEELA